MVKNNINNVGLTKKVFITLLSFSGSFVHVAKVSDCIKCISLNEPCSARPTLIDLNSNELRYYSIMVSLDRCILEVVILLMIS